MQVSEFHNFPVNVHQKFDTETGKWVVANPNATEFWNTGDVHTSVPGQVGSIGRVDHFRLKSIKQIVAACRKQVIEREGQKGKHIITIELHQTWDYANGCEIPAPFPKKTVTIDVIV